MKQLLHSRYQYPVPRVKSHPHEVDMLSLDTILSSLTYHARLWSPGLARTQARDLLRYVVIRLHSAGRGNLYTASLTISQSALADKIGITREWCNQLLAQLQETGWLTYTSGRREGGLRTTCTYAIGNMFRRLLIMLAKSHIKKAKQKPVVKSAPQAGPLFLQKSNVFLPEEEKFTISEELYRRNPLLKVWIGRGK